MGESSVHIILVQAILDWIATSFRDDSGMSIYVDSVDSVQKPPPIEFYVPDVYVEWISSHCKLIGEAKTAKDLDREHSRQQIAAFLRYLDRWEDPQLVIATPWYAINNARGILEYIKRTEGISSVRTVVLDKLPG